MHAGDQNSPTVPSHQSIMAAIEGDMVRTNAVIRDRLQSQVPLINKISEYIINAGGKRLRPVLVLLMANAYGYRGDNHLQLAAIIEFIHTATLLHDDVVDESGMRRGRETANAIFGNAASVLVGDFLYSRSFQMMVAVGNERVMQIVADAVNVISEGEVLQLLNMHNPDVPEEGYLQVIRSKTARLFEAAAQLGALIAGASEAEVTAAGEYGSALGTAFQLIDDVLDYSGNAADIGKNVGDDLREGKPTLPLIHVIAHGSPAQKELVQRCIREGDEQHFDAILAAVNETGALEYTRRCARNEARRASQAIQSLPASPYRQALLDLAEFAVQRNH